MKNQTSKLSIFKPSKLIRPESIKGGTDSEGIIIEDETLG